MDSLDQTASSQLGRSIPLATMGYRWRRKILVIRVLPDTALKPGLDPSSFAQHKWQTPQPLCRPFPCWSWLCWLLTVAWTDEAGLTLCCVAASCCGAISRSNSQYAHIAACANCKGSKTSNNRRKSFLIFIYGLVLYGLVLQPSLHVHFLAVDVLAVDLCPVLV